MAKTREIRSPLYVVVEDSDLRFLTGFQFRARTSRAARLDLANTINDRLRIVRATASDGNDPRLEIDWYLHVETETPTNTITAALRRFGSAVLSALKIDADGRKALIVERGQPEA